MKKNIYTPPVKFLTIASGLFLFLTSCQDVENNLDSNTKEAKIETETSKIIDFNGLTVKHRFRTPVEDLEIELTDTGLKQMYSKIKNPHFQLSKTSGNTDLLELPDTDLIIEATKLVTDIFPYNFEREPMFIKSEEQKFLDTVSIEIREYILANNLIDLSKDSLRLVEHEKNVEAFHIKQEKKKWEMIRDDFEGLSDEQIETNIDLIDEYYKKNMNYEILLTAEEKKQELTTKIASKTQKTTNLGYESGSPSHMACVLDLSGTLANTLSVRDAGEDARDLAAQEYSNLPGANDRRDAFRHLMWNVLLAKYYITMSTARSTRTDFAKRVADAYEECGDNDLDSEAMDLHNNTIGRGIYWDHTSIKRNWLGIPYGVSEAPTSTYAADAKNRVENQSCFIVKEYDEVFFPERYLVSEANNKDEPYIKSKIENIDNSKVVYFIGPIAPSSEYLITSEYDYSACTSADLPYSTTTYTTITLPWLGSGGGTITIPQTTYAPCVNRMVLKCYQL
ncbi:DUF6973 domain-containing protein [Wenyingzhuangia marina]|uniref:DUF6973 domain-containing protein n=1 Tax=Wenyingzhuangia marina TaxID=1195760 RepID=A0A1M5SV43_9FLAO|nr:hypothetical protein [Wenyingzhuangia marina]GGF64181.1 hypothetical protein GCM10011397_03960 [Wenyingzhuangia marina]SHH42357.1 hypothetical protein SAMN05444281_0538 [Wenyingzhuangia marina]